MFYGSNLFKKDNPSWPIRNAAEATKVPYSAVDLLALAVSLGAPSVGIAGVTGWVRSTCGICASWLIGLPRRAGAGWYEVNDAEARWSGWLVTERRCGLGRQYRDARFQALRLDPTLRRDDLWSSDRIDRAAPAQPQCPSNGDL